jgi:uncharacterized protein (TIGR03118 family)
MDRNLSRSRIAPRRRLLASLLAGVLSGITATAHASLYQRTDLTTDDNTNLTNLGFPVAANVDPNLVNPWGVSFSAASPFWVSDNVTGLATLYRAAGVPRSLVVTIAPPASPPPGFTASAPTGQVNNGTTGFVVSNGLQPTDPNFKSGPAAFIFATEDGTISGWNPTVNGTNSIREVDNSSNPTPATGAVYKGLAIATNNGSTFLYATNFRAGTVEMYNSSFGLVKSFTDTNLPTVPTGTPTGQNWAPFNVQLLNGQLYVTFVLQNAAKHDDVAGAGNGFVDVFDLNGNFVKRLINTGPGDPLDSPWGLAIAPAGFGAFADDLMVGNFGNGEINAFDPSSGAFRGTLDASSGNPIEIPGLWDLTIANSGAGVDPNGIYFTAGLPGGRHSRCTRSGRPVRPLGPRPGAGLSRPSGDGLDRPGVAQKPPPLTERSNLSRRVSAVDPEFGAMSREVRSKLR